MNLLTLIFAIFILSVFWGGFFMMLIYLLKLKSREEKEE